MLLTICDQLYEDSVISQESFITWETNTDPAEQEGKGMCFLFGYCFFVKCFFFAGVALKQLTSFFTQLKENDEDLSEEDDVQQ